MASEPMDGTPPVLFLLPMVDPIWRSLVGDKLVVGDPVESPADFLLSLIVLRSSIGALHPLKLVKLLRGLLSC